MRLYQQLVTATLVLAIISAAPAGNPHDLNLPPLLYDENGEPVQAWSGNCIALSNPWLGGKSNCRDDITMTQVGILAGPMYNTMAGGDSDRDSLFEAYMYIKDNPGAWTYTYRIYESDGHHNYTMVHDNTEGIIPYEAGDFDGDGLYEVMGHWSYYVRIYESPSPGTLATQRVWSSPQMTNVVGFATVGDLDGDGNTEIIHTRNSFGTDNRLVIFENTGNNTYVQIFEELVAPQNLGWKAVADFDLDGRSEVAFASGGGEVFVYEGAGNNTFVRTFYTSFSASNCYACALGNDMDGNGRPEFAVGGSSSSQGWVTRIYEAAANDSFVVRQEICIYDGYVGMPGNAIGDLDGDGVDELVIQTAQALHLYKWNGFEWSSEGIIPENFGYILHGVFCYDGDHNGWDEIFWLGLGDSGWWTNSTVILECEGAGGPPVTVTVTPDTLPLTIPPGGGRFDYSIEVANGDTALHYFDAAIFAVLPDSSELVIMRRDSLPIGPGATLTRRFSQAVPLNAPAGDYTFGARIGNLPTAVWDEDSFNFQKAGNE